jgi:DNA-binding SARP family transcriptional activator/DNA-binding XRE family transcriptional regulator
MIMDASVTTGESPGEVLRRFRRRAALTQDELAQRSGLSIRTMRDLESGRVRRPRQASLDRLANQLDLSEAERAQLGRLFRELPEATDPRVRVAILGPVQAQRGGHPVQLGQPLQRTLFALLALRRNALVSTDEVVDVLWGHRPPRTCLRQARAMAGRLDHLLNPDPPARTDGPAVRRTPGGCRLDIDDELIDAGRFQRLLDGARRPAANGDPVAGWRAAVACWRGPVVADTNDQLRMHPAALALDRRRVEAVLGYADAASAVGRHHDAVDALQELAGAERLHEAVHARLVHELARAGDPAAALRHYTTVRRRLAEELRTAPGERLRLAYRFVTRAEPPTEM